MKPILRFIAASLGCAAVALILAVVAWNWWVGIHGGWPGLALITVLCLWFALTAWGAGDALRHAR